MLDKDAFENALASFSSDARKTLQTISEEERFKGVIPYAVAEQLAREAKLEMPQLMLALVPFATLYAQPAISDYSVGAIAQGSTTGSLYYGANMEFVGGALSFTVHAEQAALTNAWNNREEGISELAVSAAPCGYCRQFLYEITTAAKLLVLLPETPAAPLTSLLPDAFGPNDIRKGILPLMTPENHGLELDEPSQDRSVLEALQAANASYAPYTFGYAGVAVETTEGDLYTGRLAENAAFNPSMSPLESALVMKCLAGDATSDVRRVSLVQANGAVADQESATRAVAASLGPVTIDINGARLP